MTAGCLTEPCADPASRACTPTNSQGPTASPFDPAGLSPPAALQRVTSDAVAGAAERLRAFRARRSDGLPLRLAAPRLDLAQASPSTMFGDGQPSPKKAKHLDVYSIDKMNAHDVALGGGSTRIPQVQDLPLLVVALSSNGPETHVALPTMAIKRLDDISAVDAAAPAAHARPTSSSLHSTPGHA